MSEERRVIREDSGEEDKWKKKVWLSRMVHTFNPRILEVKAARFRWVRGQPGIYNLTLTKNKNKKKIEKKKMYDYVIIKLIVSNGILNSIKNA